MREWRVTKYNPAKRGSNGSYLDGEKWTAFSDVEKGQVSLSEYERVERAYIEVAARFMHEAGVSSLRVVGLENSKESPVTLHHGQELGPDLWEMAFKLVLREVVWARFEADAAFVHFGWDYYMYVGVQSACPKAIDDAKARGLFVERCVSPHHLSAR